MDTIGFFKLQSKNLLRDFKTGYRGDDGSICYSPRFFPDIDGIIISYDIDENDFSLMKAQHIIALMAGFKKWSDILSASDAKLQLGKLLFEESFNNPNIVEEWEMYTNSLHIENLSDDSYLEIFKKIFLTA